MTRGALPSSFRDPSGFLFEEDGVLLRQINGRYREDYERLRESGLYDALVADGLLVPHEEVASPGRTPEAWKVIRPERVPFVSYPYEWSFHELKDAALATLKIARRCLAFGMALKDASAYNVQFPAGRPVLIDTLSFRRADPGEPWEAYRQFCQHFLAPLALMSRRDVRLSQWFRVGIDGVPLDLASALLPRSSWLAFGLLSHLHLHARSQKRWEGSAAGPPGGRAKTMGRFGLEGLLASLESSVSALAWEPRGTTWAEYYDHTNYAPAALAGKEAIVRDYLAALPAGIVWDFGANVGPFSRVAAARASYVVAFDVDPAAVDRNYLEVARRGERNLLPLVLDLTNPSAAIGWANRERQALAERGPADVGLALALVHHLAIGNNVPLPAVAAYFGELCRSLVVEFVPKEDSQVRRMLATRPDVFPDYHVEGFERAFGEVFAIERRQPVLDSARTLYAMRRRN
jgi:hypothetical protein